MDAFCAGHGQALYNKFKSQLTTLCPSVIVWRWGKMRFCLWWLLKRRLCLSKHFCADKMKQAQKQYGGGGEAEQTHGDAPSNNSEVGKALDFTFIESALRSNRFWGTMVFMERIHAWPHELREWAESCPCHDFLRRDDNGAIRSKEDVTKSRDYFKVTCSIDSSPEQFCPYDGPHFNVEYEK